MFLAIGVINVNWSRDTKLINVRQEGRMPRSGSAGALIAAASMASVALLNPEAFGARRTE
jgi:hypothetical protein